MCLTGLDQAEALIERKVSRRHAIAFRVAIATKMVATKESASKIPQPIRSHVTEACSEGDT